MAKKTVNSDIYNLSKLVDDVKSAYIPDETDETLAIGTYGYIGALESSRLQTQVQMTGELSNEVFPSRARLERNIITHAIMANIDDINAVPAKMSAFFAVRESDIYNSFNSDNEFIIDRECPIYVGDYEFHLEYDIILKRIYIASKKTYTYTAQYDIPAGRDVPTSTITTSNQYLSPPVVVNLGGENYIYLTVILSQVQHFSETKKLVTSNVIDNKTMNFEFEDQLAYFEIHCAESDEDYYILPVFEGSAVPTDSKSKYFCWYQYIDTNLIRVRFDRQSYMPGLNATVECLVKTCKGSEGNFKYNEDTYVSLESSKYGYKGINALLTPITESSGGKDRKSKTELQSLIPKELLSRGSLTTITDLNNYFGMLDSEFGRIVIQKKIDNQIERVYYAYFVAKDSNDNIIPANTIDVKVGLEDLIESQISGTSDLRYLLKSGTCFKLGSDGVGYVNHDPVLDKGLTFTANSIARGKLVEDTFTTTISSMEFDAVSCSANLNGCYTPLNLFNNDNIGSVSYITNDTIIEAEDYLQMNVGGLYKFTVEYITKSSKESILLKDAELDCFEFVKGYYVTEDDPDNLIEFESIPFRLTGLRKRLRVTFTVIVRLTSDIKGIASFKEDVTGKEYFLNQKSSMKMSVLLDNLGIDGDISEAESDQPSVISLTEVDPEEDDPKPSDNPYTLHVVNENDVPPIESRSKNNWYYIVGRTEEKKEENKNETDAKYVLHVVDEDKKPSPEERSDNNWYYTIQKSQEIPETENLNAGNKEVSESKSNDNGEPSRKEYRIDILRNIEPDDNVVLTVKAGNGIYTINVTLEMNTIKDVFTISEAGTSTSTEFMMYIPTLVQEIPESYEIGQEIKYTLRYRSISNSYAPKIIFELSRGLEYNTFSNKIHYEGQAPYSVEPGEISINTGTSFLYANPYAANINALRLYSSFYMMSMEENPYIHFDHINQASNVQFISTNAYWKRAFLDNSDYDLSLSVTQSVQENIGVFAETPEGLIDTTVAPLVKAVAVFKRDGEDYRYKTMDICDVDPSTFTIKFKQTFTSEDLFDNNNNIKVTNFQVVGQLENTIDFTYQNGKVTINNGETIKLSKLMEKLGITDTIKSATFDTYNFTFAPIYNDQKGISDYYITALSDFNYTDSIEVIGEASTYIIEVKCNKFTETEYGFFNPITELKVYIACKIGESGSIGTLGSICPGLEDWTLTNIYDIVNGVTFYHNYSEIMGSRVIPYGTNKKDESGNDVMELEGYYIYNVPMIGYDYCQNEELIQSAINSLNYRKSYIDNAVNLLENSFGVDFKLFNTYGPSKTYYIIHDARQDGILDENDTKEYIDRVNLTMNFRLKLVSTNDSYTRDNIIKEIKGYIEDLDDLSELHIPNLVTQITTNYKEQISYFEYLGFNDYGPEIQHIYKDSDSEIGIHTAPEFICVNNIIDNEGNYTPDINIYVSEI